MSKQQQMRFNPDHEEEGVLTPQVEFPSTRYQGSKRKIIDWIWKNIRDLDFDSLLDGFGGTGVVAHRAKLEGKKTFYNDFLRFNHQIGLALIENAEVTLSDHDIELLTTKHNGVKYPAFIQEEFEGLYYLDEENAWLDRFRKNLDILDDKYKQAIAYGALAQACLAKRPYNLFHRANLYMRTQEVERSFGNKTTWDRSFDEHFRRNVAEFNAAVFDNGRENLAFNQDILQWDGPLPDLVYLDPPYYSRKKANAATDYQFYYHFLEGFIDYSDWPERIDHSVKTKRLDYEPSPWTDKDRLEDAFEMVLKKFQACTIAISYNTGGFPRPEDLVELVESYKRESRFMTREHQYALSRAEDSADELLIVAWD